MSAAFASRSSRFDSRSAQQGPNPGAYDTHNYNTMAGNSARGSRRQSVGSFGGAAGRDLPWQRSDQDTQSIDDVPVPSTFGGAPSARGRANAPSAAFAGASSRFAPSKAATPGPGEYGTPRTPLTPNSNRLNRSSSFGGKTKRFGAFKQEDTPGPGEFAPRPGAFAAAGSKSARAPNSGFGGRAARESPFAATADAAPPPGAYDAHASTGAFGASSARRNSQSSASFASRSSRFDRPGSAQDGAPDPTAYDPASYGSMASAAGKSFNRKSSNGAGGFGTSARRAEVVPVGDAADTPGPGQYADARSSTPGGRRAARPSAAFASTSKNVGSYIRKTDAPDGPSSYDAHAATGMAAMAARSFNKNVGTGRFGPRAARPLGDETSSSRETPGPGSYGAEESRRPSSARVKPSGSFASTSLRDTSAWTQPGLRS